MKTLLNVALGAFLGVGLAAAAMSLRAESPGSGGGLNLEGILEQAIRNELSDTAYQDFEGIRVPIYDRNGRRTGTTLIDDRGVTVTDRDGNVVNKFDEQGSFHYKPEVFSEIVLPQSEGGSFVIGTEGMKYLSDAESSEYLWTLGLGGFCMPLQASLSLDINRFCFDYKLVDSSMGRSTTSGGSGSALPWERNNYGYSSSSNGSGLTMDDKVGRTAIFQDNDRYIIGGYLIPPVAEETETHPDFAWTPRASFRWQPLSPSLELKGAYEFDLGDSTYRKIPEIREDCIRDGRGGEICLGATGFLGRYDALGSHIDFEFEPSDLGDNCAKTERDTDICIGPITIGLGF